MRICHAHGIPYYMLGGTLLGAVRHHDIIPWDDDMDFGVPRAHFERLKKALREGLKERYCVCEFPAHYYINSPALKISDRRTEIFEVGKEDCDAPIGVNIDVFPLDRTNNSRSLFSRNGLIQALTHIDQFRYRREFDSMKKRLIGIVVKCAFFWLDRLFFTRLAERIAPHGTGDYVANHYGFWRMRETVPARYFGQPKPYEMGGRTYDGVADADAYLTALYGDYMQLPPEDQRHTHLVTACWKK